jgi:Rod binding domain-containing protein
MPSSLLSAAISPPLFTPETSPSLRGIRSHFATPASAAPLQDVNRATPEMQRVGQEFESMFLTEMLKPMFEGLKTDELGGGGEGEDAFRPMLIEKYAEAVSHSGGIGIADAIVRELMRMQTMGTAPAAPAATPGQTPTQTEEADHGPIG